MKLEFVIPIVPVPWSRARSNKKTGTYFHAKPYLNFQREIRYLIKACFIDPPFDGPLKVSCTFVFESPGRRKFGEHQATKPDIDNLFKGVADSLEGILWTNDSRITDLSLKKLYDLTGGKPRIELIVEEIKWN